MIRHMRTHSGQRPFNCIECGYAFTTKEMVFYIFFSRFGLLALRRCFPHFLHSIRNGTSYTLPVTRNGTDFTILIPPFFLSRLDV